MPVAIDQHTIDIRMTLLEIEIDELQALLPHTEGEKFDEVNEAIDGRSWQLKECKLWMKILRQDPGWGDLVNVDGKRMPNMPVFESDAQRTARLGSWDGSGSAGDGLDLEQAMRAREANSRNQAQESVQFMDGEGPIAMETFPTEPE